MWERDPWDIPKFLLPSGNSGAASNPSFPDPVIPKDSAAGAPLEFSRRNSEPSPRFLGVLKHREFPLGSNFGIQEPPPGYSHLEKQLQRLFLLCQPGKFPLFLPPLGYRREFAAFSWKGSFSMDCFVFFPSFWCFLGWFCFFFLGGCCSWISWNFPGIFLGFTGDWPSWWWDHSGPGIGLGGVHPST